MIIITARPICPSPWTTLPARPGGVATTNGRLILLSPPFQLITGSKKTIANHLIFVNFLVTLPKTLPTINNRGTSVDPVIHQDYKKHYVRMKLPRSPTYSTVLLERILDNTRAVGVQYSGYVPGGCGNFTLIPIVITACPLLE
jgi:hypothetical protein